jgi:hypothetical protein
VRNALNFNLTAFPDSFSVIDHGGGIFSARAASATVVDFILAHKSVKLGRSVYFLHRSATGAATAVSLLLPLPAPSLGALSGRLPTADHR